MKNIKVIRSFVDKPNGKYYSKNNTFQSEDLERVSFLQKEGFLEQSQTKSETKPSEFPKHAGGGYYELSNGEKVKGKDEATAAEKELGNRGE